MNTPGLISPRRAAIAQAATTAVIAALLILTLLLFANAQTVDRTTLTGRVLCGYQGWFACEGDGGGLGWQHWSQGGSVIGPDLYNTDVWPDVTEYNSEDLYNCGPLVTLTNGQPGYLFSPRKQGVTDTHFRWMQENNIDGVFLQRFSGGLGNPGGAGQQHKDAVLQNIMRSSYKYGRTFCIEWDISGTSEPELFDKLTNDWTYLNTTFDMKNHSRYQYHNGRPVVSIWGIGITDRPGTAQQFEQIIGWFHGQNVFVIGGVAPGWRTLSGVKNDNPAWWTAVYNSLDGISPWTVGAYADWGGIQYFRDTFWGPDIVDCNSRGVVYIPVAWSRFGWDNANHLPCGTSKFPTRGGQHLWDQSYAQKSVGSTTQKIAMFDECDESTAILKMSDDVPVTGCWWTSEGLPHDWYLRLAGYGGKMFRGEIPLSQTLPISPSSSPDNASVVSNTIPSTMALGQQYSVSITMQNTGETCWNSEFFKLAAVGDSDPFTTTTKYAMASGATVMPGQQTTFSFTLRAPVRDGVYVTDWEMSHELITRFGAKLVKVITVGAGPTMLNNSAFPSNSDGWTTSTWRAGTSSYGTMAWNSGAGNPGGAMRSTGAGSTDNTDRCAREGGEIRKTISSVGHQDLVVSYDLRVNALGSDRTGAGTGTCAVDHSLVDEQLSVFYSTNSGSSWTETDWLKRGDLKASYLTYGTRYIDLSSVTACDNNPNFALRFRWQLNTSGDYADLDNIKVMGNIIDITAPGPVTGVSAAGGNEHVALTWTNPSDPDFTGTMVRYRTDTYPTSVTNGSLVTDEPGSPGTSDGCIHIGLTNGVTHYYAAFAHDDGAHYSTSVTASGVPQGTVEEWVNESFDAYPNGNLGGLKWRVTSEASAQVQSAMAKGGAGKALLLDTIAAERPIANEVDFTGKTAGYCYLSLDVASNSSGGSVADAIGCVTVYGSDSATEIARLWIDRGAGVFNRLLVEYGSGSWAVLTAAAVNDTWYNVKIGFNIDTRQLDLWLDGSGKGTNYAWKGTATNISRIAISSDGNANLSPRKAYIDNLRFEPKPGVVSEVRDDGGWSPSLDKLHFSFDPVLYSAEYKYAIGTTSGGTQIRNWTSCGTSTDYTATGLSLTESANYYISVQCGTLYGLWGATKNADGVKVAPGIASIQAAKALADGAPTDVKALRSKIVTGVFPGCFYIQEPGSLCGLRIASTTFVAPGNEVDACGVMKGSGAERYVDTTGCGIIKTAPGPGLPNTVVLPNASVGGADLNAYTLGVDGGIGPNNIGLYVTACGRVTQRQSADPKYFYIDDGCGLIDGTQMAGVDNVGIRINADPAGYPQGAYVVVTGVSSVFSDAGQLKRQVLPSEVRVLAP
ncbi:MAG: NBR1-Ig-like domain-containing protein [Armatimonadota bacterium]|nr:NBR1-Ig-like domain-containing protein [Armatimonadota bacterium]